MWIEDENGNGRYYDNETGDTYTSDEILGILIEESAIPLAAFTGWFEILEDSVPLAELPQTGLTDTLAVWVLGLTMSLMAVTGLLYIATRRQQEVY